MVYATRYVDSDEVVTASTRTGDDDGPDFGAFADQIRADLAPGTLLERVLSERVVLAAWRLHLISAREAGLARAGKPCLPLIGRETLRAESSLETALTILQAARQDVRRWGRAALVDSKALDAPDFDAPVDYPDYSNEWPAVPDQDSAHADTTCDDDDELEDRHLVWRDRLAFDDKVSDASPVVKGTWVTAGHVVSLIVDGWSWSDVLRTHPELNEDDVRACLAYTIHMDARGSA
jgi:uncharacterized protein (DUF433 family)